MSDPAAEQCRVCADEGLEGTVLALRGRGRAEVDLQGRRHEVAVDLVDDVRVGDRLLVHAGVAIARLGG